MPNTSAALGSGTGASRWFFVVWFAMFAPLAEEFEALPEEELPLHSEPRQAKSEISRGRRSRRLIRISNWVVCRGEGNSRDCME